MYIYWRKLPDGSLTATEKMSNATFTISRRTDGGTGFAVRVVMPQAPGMESDYDETFTFQTVGACKSFITKHFG